MRAHPAVRPATATGRQGRSGGELEQRLRRAPRRGPHRQPYPLQIGPDRGRIGQGGDDPQATATGRAFAVVGGKHPRQQGRPPQPMAAGGSARRAVRRRRLGNRLGRHDEVAGPGPGRQDTVVAQKMKPGPGEPEPPASPAVPSEESRRWRVPSGHGVLSAKQRMVGIENAQTPSRQGPAGPRSTGLSPERPSNDVRAQLAQLADFDEQMREIMGQQANFRLAPGSAIVGRVFELSIDDVGDPLSTFQLQEIVDSDLWTRGLRQCHGLDDADHRVPDPEAGRDRASVSTRHPSQASGDRATPRAIHRAQQLSVAATRNPVAQVGRGGGGETTPALRGEAPSSRADLD